MARLRNHPIGPQIGRLSRSGVRAKKGLYKRTPSSTKPAAEDKPKTITKKIGGAKNGGERTIPVNKAPRFYPAEDVRKPKASRKTNRLTKLKSSITPGTVLILVAGKFKGKRVVFLKQLPESGLLLVTGPHKLNGVPLRRINQSYTIVTSTKVDISGVKIPKNVNDAYFKREASKSRKGTEGEFFKDGKKEKKPFPSEKAEDQKNVDKAILSSISQTPNLSKYLSSSFALSRGQYPHLLQF